MSRLSLNQITTLRASLLEDVTACSDSNVPGIGLWRRKIVEFGEERSVELLRDSQLRVTSLSWAGGFTGSFGWSFEEAVQDGQEAIQLAQAVRADCLVIVSGTRNGHTANHSRRLLVEGLRSLAESAEESGVTLALQPMHRIFQDDWSFINTLDEAMFVLQECGSPSVKLALDVYHVAQEPDLLERLPELVPHLAIVQLSDGAFPPRSKYDRRQLGDGDIPIADIIRILVRNGYERFFEIALWSRELWQAETGQLTTECLERFRKHCQY